VAEGEGFEPPLPFGKAVFKTACFNRSHIPPRKHDRLTLLYDGICSVFHVALCSV
jgi:hypothetical protein